MYRIPANLIQVVPQLHSFTLPDGTKIYKPDYSELGVEERVNYDCDIAEYMQCPPRSSLGYRLAMFDIINRRKLKNV